MIVMPASRILSAISFGVFCRSAPSTSAIMRSRKVEPCAAVIFTLILIGNHQRAAGHRRTVAAAFADDGRGFAGDRGFVHRGDAFDHLAVAGDEIARLDQHDIAGFQRRRRELGARSAPVPFKQLGERLRSWSCASVAACALPRPSATASAKLANSTVNQSQRLIWNEKPRLPGAGDEIADEQDRRQRRDDLDHEHHRIAHHDARDEAS